MASKLLRAVGTVGVRYAVGRPQAVHHAWYSSHPDLERVPEDKPLKFSSSEAAVWKAIDARRGPPDDDKPWYQGIVISVSMSIFLLYFCVFREESDLDENLGMSLYDRVPGLEEKQLILNLKYYQEKGMDTTAIENRLNELRNQKDEVNE